MVAITALQAHKLPEGFILSLPVLSEQLQLCPPAIEVVDDTQDKKQARLQAVGALCELVNHIAVGCAIYRMHILRRAQDDSKDALVMRAKSAGLLKRIVDIPLLRTSSFFIDALFILGEVMMYKTVAQLVVACGILEFDDLMHEAIVRSKRVVKSVFS